MPHGVKWPDDVRAMAIALAREVGPTEVERRMGIDETTVGKWLQEIGVEAPAAMEGPRDFWAKWRESTAQRLTGVVNRGIVLAEQAADDGLTRNFREAMLGTSMAIDKVNSLTGAATSHHIQTINHQIDVGYSEQMNEFARIDAIRQRAIEASSAEMPLDVPGESSTVIEVAVVTNE